MIYGQNIKPRKTTSGNWQSSGDVARRCIGRYWSSRVQLDTRKRKRFALAQAATKIVLIALTGYGQAKDKQRAMDAGFDDQLTKPATELDLVTILTDLEKYRRTVVA